MKIALERWLPATLAGKIVAIIGYLLLAQGLFYTGALLNNAVHQYFDCKQLVQSFWVTTPMYFVIFLVFVATNMLIIRKLIKKPSAPRMAVALVLFACILVGHWIFGFAAGWSAGEACIKPYRQLGGLLAVILVDQVHF